MRGSRIRKDQTSKMMDRNFEVQLTPAKTRAKSIMPDNRAGGSELFGQCKGRDERSTRKEIVESGDQRHLCDTLKGHKPDRATQRLCRDETPGAKQITVKVGCQSMRGEKRHSRQNGKDAISRGREPGAPGRAPKSASSGWTLRIHGMRWRGKEPHERWQCASNRQRFTLSKDRARCPGLRAHRPMQLTR